MPVAPSATACGIYCEQIDPAECDALTCLTGLPLLKAVPAASEQSFYLHRDQDRLALIHQSGKQAQQLSAEWVDGKAAWRRNQPELVSRALNLHRLDSPLVVDATAGLGRDSLVMAGLGANVIALEKSPIVFALLQDARRRALLDQEVGSIAQRVDLQHTHAVSWLGDSASCERQIDEVFLDPMYPERIKTAAVKKEMRLFQLLLDCSDGADNEAALLSAARERAWYRVVVKRPIKGEFLAGSKPSFSINGRSTRFDVYTRHKLP